MLTSSLNVSASKLRKFRYISKLANLLECNKMSTLFYYYSVNKTTIWLFCKTFLFYYIGIPEYIDLYRLFFICTIILFEIFLKMEHDLFYDCPIYNCQVDIVGSVKCRTITTLSIINRIN